MQLIRGVWVPHDNEVLRPSLATKVSFIGGLLIAVRNQYWKAELSEDHLYMLRILTKICGYIILLENREFSKIFVIG